MFRGVEKSQLGLRVSIFLPLNLLVPIKLCLLLCSRNAQELMNQPEKELEDFTEYKPKSRLSLEACYYK